jgi:hypothetical protein
MERRHRSLSNRPRRDYHNAPKSSVCPAVAPGSQYCVLSVTVAEVMKNYANDSSPEEISENFGLPIKQLRALFDYAARHIHASRP